MRRAPIAASVALALVLTGAGVAAAILPTPFPQPVEATTDLMPGVGGVEAGIIADDAIYTLSPEPVVGGNRTEIYRRSLATSDTALDLGEAALIARASGFSIAEHAGNLAYLSRDGRLVLRAADGSESVPTWGADPAWALSGPVSLSANWVATSEAVYLLEDGTRYELVDLTWDTVGPGYDWVWVYDVMVSDDQVVWTGVADPTAEGVPYDIAVYTVALGHGGPTGDVVVLDESGADYTVVAGFTDDAIAWVVHDYGTFSDPVPYTRSTTVRWVPRSAPATPYQEVTLGTDGDLNEAWADGSQVAVSLDGWADAPEVVTLDLTTATPTEASHALPFSNVIDVSGPLIGWNDLDGQPWLTDIEDRTVNPVAGPPVVSSVEPPSGSTLGGTRVTLRGTGFTGASEVTFGGVPGTAMSIVAPTKIQVTAPEGSEGAVPVIVTTPLGSSPEAYAAQFSYVELATQSPVRKLADLAVAPEDVRCHTIAGYAGVPAGATGVILNVTTVRPNGPGFVVVYPDSDGTGETPAPGGSTVNFEPGADVANSAFVALPTNGKVCYYTRGAPNAGVILDVVGYTLDGSGMVLQASQRLLDTRVAYHVGEVTGPVTPQQVYTVQVAGELGVPMDAAAVLMNVTVTGATTIGNLRVFPGGEEVPETSVLNFAPGRDKASATIVALSPTGTVSFYSDSPAPTSVSPVQVILDVVGYVEQGSAYVGLSPARVMDTRNDWHVGPIWEPLNAREVYSLALSGLVPDGATAVVLNVTAIGPTANGNLRVYPDSSGDGQTPPPNASTINYIVGRDIPNQVVVALPANGVVDFYSDMGAGTVHVAVDLVGYVTAVPDRR